MDSAADTPKRGGLPHSDIFGSKSAPLSPKLFAGCHVLHRLSVPRHPPDALLRLRIPIPMRQHTLDTCANPRTSVRDHTYTHTTRQHVRCLTETPPSPVAKTIFTLAKNTSDVREQRSEMTSLTAIVTLKAQNKYRENARPLNGGADRGRTDDLLNANQALSQLSYGPGIREQKTEVRSPLHHP